MLEGRGIVAPDGYTLVDKNLRSGAGLGLMKYDELKVAFKRLAPAEAPEGSWSFGWTWPATPPHGESQPISEIDVRIKGDSKTEWFGDDFTVDPLDLNRGSGGAKIFIGFARNPMKPPITDLRLMFSKVCSLPYSYYG